GNLDEILGDCQERTRIPRLARDKSTRQVKPALLSLSARRDQKARSTDSIENMGDEQSVVKWLRTIFPFLCGDKRSRPIWPGFARVPNLRFSLGLDCSTRRRDYPTIARMRSNS